MGSTASRTDSICRDVPFRTFADRDRFNNLAVMPFEHFDKEFIVLFVKGKDDRKFVNFKLLIFRRLRVIKYPLFERDIFADKV